MEAYYIAISRKYLLHVSQMRHRTPSPTSHEQPYYAWPGPVAHFSQFHLSQCKSKIHSHIYTNDNTAIVSGENRYDSAVLRDVIIRKWRQDAERTFRKRYVHSHPGLYETTTRKSFRVKRSQKMLRWKKCPRNLQLYWFWFFSLRRWTFLRVSKSMSCPQMKLSAAKRRGCLSMSWHGWCRTDNLLSKFKDSCNGNWELLNITHVKACTEINQAALLAKKY